MSILWARIFIGFADYICLYKAAAECVICHYSWGRYISLRELSLLFKRILLRANGITAPTWFFGPQADNHTYTAHAAIFCAPPKRNITVLHIMMSKNDLRGQALAKRKALGHDQALMASVLADMFGKYFNMDDLGILGGYWPLASEADPREIMCRYFQHYGGRCALPWFSAERRIMDFVLWHPDQALKQGAGGIMMADISCDDVNALDDGMRVIPDTLIVPLVGFNNSGQRIGFGKGNYDATIPNIETHKNVRTIGLAYKEQYINSEWPVNEYDVALDYVLTPEALHDFS